MSSVAGRTITSVAVLGGGTVGTEVVKLLSRDPRFEVVGVLVRDASRERAFPGWRELVTSDPDAVASSDIVVELMGGTTLAAELSLAALDAGRTLVTANKAALAERWTEFLPYLSAGKVHLEAAVMAGVPVVGSLVGALRGCAPVSLHAVLNGTSNVILSAMESGAAYEEALADAQRLGYAEADPTLDVGGFDAAHKLSILARLAFDPGIDYADVASHTQGIATVPASVIAAHRARGRSVRLVGSVEASSGEWRASVRPVSLPHDHPLVTGGPVNTLLFNGDPLGEVLLRGPGAGGGATATAVVADVMAAAAGMLGHVPVSSAAGLPVATPGAGVIEEL